MNITIQNTLKRSLNLDSETESEVSDSEVDVSLPVIIGMIQDNNRASVEIHNIDFISAFHDYIREINSNHSWFTNNYM